MNRSLWNALDIRDYRIVFERQNLNGMGNPSDGVFTALVADGLLTSCIVEPPRNFEVCDLLIESTPVETLFDWVDGYEPAYTSVRYDDRLGIPLSIQFDDPDWLDEEYVITVTDFSHGG